MAKRGRKNKYETDVKPRFSEITEWLESGATERQIAYNLGIAYSTFNKYKEEKMELKELIKKGRRSVVTKLRGALIQKALGFDYQESKVVSEAVELPIEIREHLLNSGFTEDEISQARIVKTEIANKRSLPDVAAINLALKNYDKDNWANDPQMLALREREIKLKENNNW